MLKKNLLSLILALCLCMALAAPAWAADAGIVTMENAIELDNGIIAIPLDDAEYLDTGDGNLIKLSDLPQFDTQEEADAYFEKCRQFDQQISDNMSDIIEPMTVRRDVLVDQKEFALGYTLSLRVNYETTGNAVGDITYCKAYTTFEGIVPGTKWEEKICREEISSSGKDIYAYANGDIVHSIIVAGFIELTRQNETLSGYVYAIH